MVTDPLLKFRKKQGGTKSPGQVDDEGGGAIRGKEAMFLFIHIVNICFFYFFINFI